MRLYGVPRGAADRSGFFEVPGDLPVSTLRMLIGVAAAVAVLGVVIAVAVVAACVTLTGMPAILIVADRELVPVFAGTV
jgi:hypothetical protein